MTVDNCRLYAYISSRGIFYITNAETKVTKQFRSPRVSKSLSYHWLRCLTDVRIHLKTDQYKLIANLSLMVFLFLVSLVCNIVLIHLCLNFV